MFKQLRIKFIALIMTMLAIVLAIVFAGICYADYQRNANDLYAVLDESIARTASQEGPNAFREDFRPGFEQRERGPSALDDGFELDDFDDLEDYMEMYGPQIGGRDIDMRDLTPVAVYTFGANGSLSVINRATTAYISEEVVSEAAAALADSADGDGVLSDISLAYSVRTVGDVRYVAFADASPLNEWQTLALTLLLAGLGMLAVFFVISLFFSNWALKPVREAWDSQRQFVADASHELKTPLTVILANSSILLKHPDQTVAAQSQWVESTEIEAQRMQGLVNEMLELAQVESRAQIQHEPVDLSELVLRESLQFESVAFERGCAFETDTADGLVVSGDETRLSKLVSTLIENAFKYVDEGGTVELSLARHGKDAQLSVRNTGSFISAEDLPHIFDRFYRTDKARTSGAGGFGLGLAIAREIAREHGGDIVATSSEEQGTTFLFTVPIL